MNIIYTKTILYIYGVADSIINQLDELAERKAYSSMVDFSPCLEQCEKILELTNQKNIILYIKKIISKILTKLTDYQKDLLDYKYFKKRPKEYYKNFDYQSRAYFRSQVKVVEIISEKLDNFNLDDLWFVENCLSIEFFKEMTNRVIEMQNLTNKNKPKSHNTQHNKISNSEFCSKFTTINKKSKSLNNVKSIKKTKSSVQTA